MMIVEVKMLPVFTGERTIHCHFGRNFQADDKSAVRAYRWQYSLGDLTVLFSVLRSTAY
ncbi:hypothetical protein [Photorhabdus aegyptia]|uniref:hypothetical protein n=1 Tax=Photorhabdus aegyptia TaxID=2805098 RepID=UPI001363602E|nr:hypothetical protein [Photorhabdus aegyptia]